MEEVGQDREKGPDKGNIPKSNLETGGKKAGLMSGKQTRVAESVRRARKGGWGHSSLSLRLQ